MSISAAAGRPADPTTLVDVDELIGAYYDERPDPAEPTQRVAFGTSGHRGSSFARTFNEAHIARHHAGDLPIPGEPGHRRPALPRQRHARALGARARARARGARRATASTSMVDAGDGYTPTPVISHAILTHNRGRSAGARRRHRHHAVAQPARGRRLQVQPAARRPGRHRRHRAGSRTRGQRAPRRGPRAACGACRSSRRCAPTTTRGTTTSARYVDDLAQRDRPRRASRDAGCGSASIRSAAPASRYWDADRRALRPRPRRRERRRRPDLPLHDRRLGRQDPHGLLVAVRDGRADRAARTASTSPSATTPTPTATASSRRARAC